MILSTILRNIIQRFRITARPASPFCTTLSTLCSLVLASISILLWRLSRMMSTQALTHIQASHLQSFSSNLARSTWTWPPQTSISVIDLKNAQVMTLATRLQQLKEENKPANTTIVGCRGSCDGDSGGYTWGGGNDHKKVSGTTLWY